MTEKSSDTAKDKEKPTARRGAGTAAAGGAAKAARTAKDTAQKAGDKTGDKTGDKAGEKQEAARGSVMRKAAGVPGVGAAAGGLANGAKAVTSVTGKATTAAAAGWTVVKHRKAVAAGTAAGVASMVGAAFLAGRHTARPRGNLLTRLTSRGCAPDPP
jgi:hypothetical protein